MLLLEAGRDDHWWDLPVQLPIAMSVPVGSRWHDWRYVSEPEPGLGGRRIAQPRGRLLGGSGAINGMIYTYFRRLERCPDEPDGTTRGRTGPQSLQRSRPRARWSRRSSRRRPRRGHTVRPDVNDDVQEGFGPLDQAVRRGRRATTAREYLRPVRRRPNLTVHCGATVSRVVIARGRAVGVAYRQARGPERVIDAGEVILSTGAFGTPQLLHWASRSCATCAASRSRPSPPTTAARRCPAGT
jgi:choline dehydrogenase